LLVRLAPQLTHVAVPRAHYPVDTLEYMAEHKLTRGRIVVSFGWAQYVLAAFGDRHSEDTGLLLAFDGRHRTCYPQELMDVYMDFELGNGVPRFRSPDSPPFDPHRALELGNP